MLVCMSSCQLAIDETKSHKYPKLKPYSVIVRYGHLFVVYGHLRTIDPNVWVGKVVNAGTRLGTIGTFNGQNDPHVHITLMGFGDTSPDPLLTWVLDRSTGKPNAWSIPKFKKSISSQDVPRPLHTYDFTQFFSTTDQTLFMGVDTASSWSQDYDGLQATSTVKQLGGTNATPVLMGFPCAIPYHQTYTNTSATKGWVSTANLGYRSFIFMQNLTAAVDPNIVISPSPISSYIYVHTMMKIIFLLSLRVNQGRGCLWYVNNVWFLCY